MPVLIVWGKDGHPIGSLEIAKRKGRYSVPVARPGTLDYLTLDGLVVKDREPMVHDYAGPNDTVEVDLY